MLTLLIYLFLIGLSAANLSNEWPLPIFDAPTNRWHNYGNHRYAINVSSSENDIVSVSIPFRRIDNDPLSKDAFIFSVASNKIISNCTFEIDKNNGDYFYSFIPDISPGIFYLYYLPFTTCAYIGGSCPYGQGSTQIWYDPVSHCSKASFSVKNNNVLNAIYESRTPFDSLTPMLYPMTNAEYSVFIARNKPNDTSTGAILITESRNKSISMTSHLPSEWLSTDRKLSVWNDTVRPGENYTFQIGVYSSFPGSKLNIQSIEFPLEGWPHAVLKNVRCMNSVGTNYWSQAVSYSIPNINPLEIYPLWIALEVSSDAISSLYSGNVLISLTNGGKTEVLTATLNVQVEGSVIENGGDDDIYRGTRLQWLDNQIGSLTDLSIPSPYIPITLKSTPSSAVISMLDKTITLASNGLPQFIEILTNATNVLSFPIDVDLGSDFSISSPWVLKIDSSSPAKVSWTSNCLMQNTKKNVVEVIVKGNIDVTGYLDYRIITTALDESVETDFQLKVPSNKDFLFAMGLGKRGGFIKKIVTDSSTPLVWKWDNVNGNNGAWSGSTKGGIRTFLKGDDPLWQAGVPYDNLKSPLPPISWSNNGNGGIRLFQNHTLEAFSGSRTLDAKSSVSYLFSFLVTPVRPLDLKKHWSLRYAQIGYTANSANFTYLSENKATVVNIHQGNAVNPWINYPYLTNDIMKKTSDLCHSLGMKFSIYNTMRELSNRCLEIYPMLAFGETFVENNEKGGEDWLQEHLSDFPYSPAWSTPLDNFVTDAAIRVNALSRWNNYYVKGIDQMKKDFNLDGIYLDEIAYDRVTMLRTRNILGNDGVIDHHSDSGGFCLQPAMNYLELFPFIDRLWYGEGFDYDGATADYWLVEMSGLCFGLTSDMLRYPGETPYHFRGFAHASSNRWQSGLEAGGESDIFNPIALWKFWDENEIQNSTMFGWWNEVEMGKGYNPVSSSSDSVVVTSYVQYGKSAIIVLANFDKNSIDNVKLIFNMEQLGLSPTSVNLFAPVIIPFQADPVKGNIPLDQAFNIVGGQGLILVISNNSNYGLNKPQVDNNNLNNIYLK